MPTITVKNVTGGTLPLPVSGTHFDGLAVSGSYTASQAKSGSVPDEVYEAFMAGMAAGIGAGSWTVVQTAADWPIVERTENIVAGPVADTGTFTVTAPVRLRARGYTPVSIRVYTVGAGAVGARTQTHYPLVDTTGTGIRIATYVESTGVLTLANESGGALSAIHVQVAWARVTV